MNLQFTNKGGNFVSEFEVTSDFNLHIEGVRLSDMHIYQKTAGGSYAKVTDFPSERSQDRVADFDFASLVYPKFIKVVCATEPTYAEIATDGEVTEIKSQSKEVEIVSNGVTEIAPDAGFGYLSGVKVNVNVPQSGGGDVPSGGGSNYKYFDVSNIVAGKGTILSIATLIKTNDNKDICVLGQRLTWINDTILNLTDIVDAIAVDMSCEVILSGTPMTVGDFVSILEEHFGVLPIITKEEFYAF